MYDLIIIGGGPAGMTAAIYALRKRLKMLLVTKDLGGKSNWRMALPGVEEYHQVIRGLDVVTKYRQELEYLDFARHMEGVEKVTQTKSGFSVTTVGGGELTGRAVIIATGTRVQRLDVEGEADYLMKGLSYSALSYAPLMLDKTAVVIGDDDLAVRSAAELATVAKHVHLITPTGHAQDSELAKRVIAKENVSALAGYHVLRVLGNEFAEKVLVRSPEGKESEIATDGIFVERQIIPNTEIVKGLVDMDEDGRIKVDCQGRTSVPGLFAAGDVSNSTEQILVAVGDGAKAAIAAYNYLLMYI